MLYVMLISVSQGNNKAPFGLYNWGLEWVSIKQPYWPPELLENLNGKGNFNSSFLVMVSGHAFPESMQGRQ